ncbi:hypothetical protein BC828DRAFT_380796 [Blastocladiella britannica]|nr:hypothetical protein BC828DRAFT_380796 [Blastocladiella britannica]
MADQCPNLGQVLRTLGYTGDMSGADCCQWVGVQCTGGVITSLQLGQKGLSGTIPDLSALVSLQILNLGGNQLTGTIPSLSALKELTELYLDSNKLTGSMPDLSGLGKLKTVLISGGGLTGPIPNMTGLWALTTLSIGQQSLEGPFPDLSGMPSLQFLNMGGNRLNGKIPDLKGPLSLLKLFLDTNQFSGSLPDLSALTSLQTLSLGKNLLDGTIPNLNAPQSLQYLQLGTNRFTGKVPDMSGLKSLQELYMGGNRLTGRVGDLSGLVGLQNLSIANNSLTGPFPDVSKLVKLTSLYLYGNAFSGAVPNFPNAANNCTVMPQKVATTLCFAGSDRTGPCYVAAGGAGLSTCTPEQIAASASGASDVKLPGITDGTTGGNNGGNGGGGGTNGLAPPDISSPKPSALVYGVIGGLVLLVLIPLAIVFLRYRKRAEAETAANAKKGPHSIVAFKSAAPPPPPPPSASTTAAPSQAAVYAAPAPHMSPLAPSPAVLDVQPQQQQPLSSQFQARSSLLDAPPQQLQQQMQQHQQQQYSPMLSPRMPAVQPLPPSPSPAAIVLAEPQMPVLMAASTGPTGEDQQKHAELVSDLVAMAAVTTAIKPPSSPSPVVAIAAAASAAHSVVDDKDEDDDMMFLPSSAVDDTMYLPSQSVVSSTSSPGTPQRRSTTPAPLDLTPTQIMAAADAALRSPDKSVHPPKSPAYSTGSGGMMLLPSESMVGVNSPAAPAALTATVDQHLYGTLSSVSPLTLPHQSVASSPVTAPVTLADPQGQRQHQTMTVGGTMMSDKSAMVLP